MSHRKVHSQGNVPFSWEDKPGVSKVEKKHYRTETGASALDCASQKLAQPPSTDPMSFSEDKSGVNADKGLNQNDFKIPLPPCLLKAPSRSASARGLKWQAEEDPFLLAFKVCTRNTTTSSLNSPGNNEMVAQKNKRGSVAQIGSKLKKKYSEFSCKSNSCEVRDSNFVKLPPLPRERIHLSRCKVGNFFTAD